MRYKIALLGTVGGLAIVLASFLIVREIRYHSRYKYVYDSSNITLRGEYDGSGNLNFSNLAVGSFVKPVTGKSPVKLILRQQEYEISKLSLATVQELGAVFQDSFREADEWSLIFGENELLFYFSGQRLISLVVCPPIQAPGREVQVVEANLKIKEQDFSMPLSESSIINLLGEPDRVFRHRQSP